MDIITNLKEIRQKAKKEVFDDLENMGFHIYMSTGARLQYKKIKDKQLTDNSNITNKESEKQ